MADKKPNNLDATLALQVRDEVVGHGHYGHHGPPEACTRGDLKQPKHRMTIENLVQDKLYDGKIVKKIRAGLLIDINAGCLGLLRWRLVK